jgi:hypothetical protein
VGKEYLRNFQRNFKVENVRGVDVESSSVLGFKIHTQVYLGGDNLGDLSVHGIIVLKMGVRPN